VFISKEQYAMKNIYTILSGLSKGYPSPGLTSLIIAAALSFSEAVNMFLLGLVDFTVQTKAILDVFLLMLVMIPVIHFLVYRPMSYHIKCRKQAEEELLETHENLEQRIRKIVEGIEKINNGDPDYRLKIQMNDELGKIAAAVNRATDTSVGYQRLLEKDLNMVKEQKRHIFQVYSDVIFSVTQGKFNLLNHDQVLTLCLEGELLNKTAIIKPEDVNEARELATRILKEQPLRSKDTYHVILCISEAVTNALKHANAGSLELRKIEGSLRACISDCGPGMDLSKLPNMVFFQGFSTKISMGYGYTIMYKYAEKIYLASSNEGTFLALDFKI